MRMRESNETCESLLCNLVLINFIFEKTRSTHATRNRNKSDSSNRSIQR